MSIRPALIRSSTFRLALMYLALFGASVMLLLGFIYWFTAGYMARQADATIERELEGLAARYEFGGVAGLSALIGERVARQRPTGTSLYLLVDARYQPLVGNLNAWPGVEPNRDGWLVFRLEGEGRTGADVHAARARSFALPGGFRLLVGRDVHELEALRRVTLRTMAWGLAITVILGLIGAMLMTRGLLRRIEAINATSREIMSGDLSRRVPSHHSGDDFDQLADHLNGMLDQIESLMEGVRRVSDNVAHDLRTPLARLRNHLETARMQDADAETRRRMLDKALADADGLLATFNALLRIARIEAEERRAGFAPVELATLIADVAELYEPLAEEKAQRLLTEIASRPTVSGDRDLLFQALANLVDNAIKYTPAQGTVRIALGATDTEVAVTVADCGPGIPEGYREKVFQRFFRIDPSRTGPGSGLGLSLVAAVARLHHARIELGDAQPGLTVRLSFPLSELPPNRERK